MKSENCSGRSSGRIVFMSVVGVILCVALPRSGSADGVLLSPLSLRPATREQLERVVADAARRDPEVFRELARIRDELPELDASKRGGLVPVAEYLRRLGPRSLAALLQEIALDAEPKSTLSESAWLAWRLGLVEALGDLRDPRSVDVLSAILEGPEDDFLVVRSATRALGKVGSDEAVSRLLLLSETRSEKRLAVLGGMGHCHRPEVAARLGELLLETKDRREAIVISQALGDIGSSWGWQTRALSGTGLGPSVRRLAAEGLIEGFLVQEDARVREHITQALLLVDWEDTPSLISSATRGAGAEMEEALVELQRRFEQSPLYR